MSVAVTSRPDPWVPGRLTAATNASTPTTAPAEGVRDDWFPGIDLRAVTDAAHSAATAAGCEYAAVRITSSASLLATSRDTNAVGQSDSLDRGMSVRVLRRGRWGFAAGSAISPSDAADLSRRAVRMAEISATIGRTTVSLAPEPVHRGWWASPAQLDPFDVAAADRMALLISRSEALLRSHAVEHVSAHATAVRERTHYADTAGSYVQQQRTRVLAEWTAIAVTSDGFVPMRTLAPPAARGWEFVAGPVAPVGAAPGWDWDAEIAAMPDLLSEKTTAPSVEPGPYDLLLDPTHLWLTIHESVGHATELDRALGYEANYAGTTFAQPQDAGSLSYGSALMTVTGDRSTPHGLATCAWDDEGVAAQSWDIVRDGILADFQLDRAMAAEFGRARSNGCAYADSFAHVPIQRMPNVSLQADPAGGTLADLVSGIDNGLLLLGDDSWSIDMQRYNFQFTPQRALRIRHGHVAGQVKNVAYQSSTPAFWHGLRTLGGPSTAMLGGAINCGKGQPGQTAAVSHGCPAAVFADVTVLNTGRQP